MVVNPFLLGLVSDLGHRCQLLMDILANHECHPDVSRFTEGILERLQQTSQCLLALRESDQMRYRPLWPYALSDYQEQFRNVALVEQVAIPVILHYDKRDHQCLQLLIAIVRETGHPEELVPVVTATSDQYYWSQPELGVVGMPVGDSGGILGWPDLFHELAHLVLAASPRFLMEFTPTANEFFEKERDKLADIGGSEHDSKWLAVAQMKWGEKQEGTWRVELAADLIATYLVGPSYGWQHTRLAVNHGSDPYCPSPGNVADHPADQARLDAGLAMLELLGLQGRAAEVSNSWLEMLDVGLHQKEPEGYQTYYPGELLFELAQTVFSRCQAQGLVPFAENQEHPNPGMVAHINQAWQVFKKDPARYSIWELETIQVLKNQLSDCGGG